MNVSAFHCINIIYIVKLHFTYEGSPCSIQLDFDANCSVGDVIMQLKEIYQIPPDKQIQLSTYDNNEILAYGIKIAELILLNPHKYKKLQIVHSFKIGKYTNSYEQSSSLVHKEVPKIEYDGTISRYSDDNNKHNSNINSGNINDGTKYHNHKRNYNMNINKENLPSTYRTNNNGNNFYYENKTYDEHTNNNNNVNSNSSNNNIINDELKNTNTSSIKYNNEQHQRMNYYTNDNNNNNITSTNRSNSLNYYSHTPMNNYNRSFNYKYSRIPNQSNNNNNNNINASTNINVNNSDNEDTLYNNIDIHPRPNTSSNFHSHWNSLNSAHI